MCVMLEPDTPETRRALNDLARQQAIYRLLKDMRIDAMVCEVEGWDVTEFPRMVRAAVPERWYGESVK